MSLVHRTQVWDQGSDPKDGQSLPATSLLHPLITLDNAASGLPALGLSAAPRELTGRRLYLAWSIV
jgi:hypothetical protein